MYTSALVTQATQEQQVGLCSSTLSWKTVIKGNLRTTFKKKILTDPSNITKKDFLEKIYEM